MVRTAIYSHSLFRFFLEVSYATDLIPISFYIINLGDFKNNASISLINVYRLSKADLLLKLILRYIINGFLASCQVSLL